MQRYSYQLSVGGHPGRKMEQKSTPKKEKSKPAADDKKSDDVTKPETVLRNGNLDATSNEEHIYVKVKNGRKQWPLSEEDEKEFLENFKTVPLKTKKKYLDFFKVADVDQIGAVSPAQFYRGLVKRGYQISNDGVVKIFTDLNQNNDLQLTVEEFMREMCKPDTRNFGDAEMKELFESIDMDKNGFISNDDLITAMQMHNVKFHPPLVPEMIRKADRDHDGQINFDEFLRAWKRHYANKFSQ